MISPTYFTVQQLLSAPNHCWSPLLKFRVRATGSKGEGANVNTKIGLAILLGLAGCAGESGQPEPAAPVSDSLQVNVTDKAITGTFMHGDDVLTFSTVVDDAQVFTTTVALHGLTLDALADMRNGVITLDGYTTATGADTTLVDEDTALISGFRKALDDKLPSQPGPTNVVEILRGSVGLWEEWPHTRSLSAVTVAQTDRSVVKLCGNIGSYVLAKHDCNVCSGYNGATNCQVYAYVGDTGTGTTYYWRNGAWSTTPYNHAVQPSEYGDCYGRCGADCGSGHVYSQDCLNHDSCVRNGHSLGSAYCDDELTSCADDALASGCY